MINFVTKIMHCSPLFLLTLYSCSVYGLAASLDIPASEMTGSANCSGTSEGQIFRNTCFVGSQGHKIIRYSTGSFCQSYKLSCNAASGTVVCAVFNSTSDTTGFYKAPSQVPVTSIGNCTGELSCSFSGTYPNPAGWSTPYVGIFKTKYSTDRIMNFTIGMLTRTHTVIYCLTLTA